MDSNSEALKNEGIVQKHLIDGNPNKEIHNKSFKNLGALNNYENLCEYFEGKLNKDEHFKVLEYIKKFYKREEVESAYVEVSFRCKRKQLFKNPNNIKVALFDFVIVEVDNGMDIALVCQNGESAKNRLLNYYKNEEPQFSIIRKANPNDFERFKKNLEDEPQVVQKTRDLVPQYNLDMKIVDAEWQFDRQRLTIYFTAPQRIDFREFVKELAKIFKTRIELRQISTREEAKQIGGIGSCGRVICCNSFNSANCHVTLEHARLQQLANNVAKLSGYCGRLKCCLLFEYNTYVEAFKDYPPLNSKVETDNGIAIIQKIDIFKKIIYLSYPEANKITHITKEKCDALLSEGKIEFAEKDASADISFADFIEDSDLLFDDNFNGDNPNNVY